MGPGSEAGMTSFFAGGAKNYAMRDAAMLQLPAIAAKNDSKLVVPAAMREPERLQTVDNAWQKA